MTIIITGGAGYVGCHIVKRMKEMGENPIIIDDLSEGHEESVKGSRLIVGDFADLSSLDQALKENPPFFVLHMAAHCLVGESVQNPSKYFRNNLLKSVQMLDVLAERKEDFGGIVFSSSAAVYGEPQEAPITEDHPTRPTNPYGESKLQFEKILEWYRQAYGVNYISLRYFNAAGADESATIGEDHSKETHLIPRLFMTALGKIDLIEIYGNDYPTSDGTCIRDYIHVSDLAEAHILALEYLKEQKGTGRIYNLGNGKGFSVLNVFEKVKQISKRPIPMKFAPRREGDPAVLVASSQRIAEELGWKPKFPSLDDIIASAARWHLEFPNGYQSMGR